MKAEIIIAGFGGQEAKTYIELANKVSYLSMSSEGEVSEIDQPKNSNAPNPTIRLTTANTADTVALPPETVALTATPAWFRNITNPHNASPSETICKLAAICSSLI